MTALSQLEKRTAALSWLTHGGELALELKGDKAKHHDVIWCLLVESVEIIDKTPDQERRWLTSGRRSGGWNMVGMSRAELVEIERIRLLSAMKPFDGATKTAPQRNDIDRALGVLEWMRFCNEARLPDRLTKAAIALARNGDHEVAHRIYCPNRKPNRQNSTEIKTRAVGYIMAGLHKSLGLVPTETTSFVETFPS